MGTRKSCIDRTHIRLKNAIIVLVAKNLRSAEERTMVRAKTDWELEESGGEVR